MSVPAWFARTVFRAQEAVMKRPTFAVLAGLERSQWLSPEAMQAEQTLRLNQLLHTALLHSPWHAARLREAELAGRVQAGAVTLADLALLPTMNKRDARDHVEQLVWRGVPGGVFRYTTGGSSGEPLIFYFGRARQAADAAGRLRARRWWGVEPGAREVYLWGAPVELNKTDRIKTVRDRLVNQLLLNAFEMSPARMDEYLGALQAWNPLAIYGYASSLALLAAHAEARGVALRLPALRVVSATGEPLFPHQRELIERMFGAAVSVEYGARDAGLMALESPDGVLLQMSETHLIEVLDAAGQPVADGEEGEAVITSLVSEAQPFIRYRTGDVVRRSARSDPGGRSLAVLDAVVGRQTDFIVAADGRIMHALAVIYVLRAVPGVGQFKLVQHALDRLEVQVVPDVRWNDAAREAVTEGLRARLGSSLAVELKLQDAIAPEASGKHRYVVSHVPLPGMLAQKAEAA
ncbi:MAG: capsule biosynthesis protein CapK [Hydrogenophilales bacterium RIFOXYD1_FULL_62_11]|nr:MAG: capsule biosynthesis protein CapK [Hydrogenophilales bacterium RIFOXYD1_FULL_62_11]